MENNSADIQVDVVGLKKLFRCIEDLRYHGGEGNSKTFWEDELFVPNFSYPLAPVKARDIHSMASHLESLERARQVIRQLGSMLDERISTLTAEANEVFAAFGRGLDSLPNEVLAIILEQAADLKSEDPRNPLRISHVSRRFRGIILSLPKAWSTISSDMHNDWLDTVTERSRSSELRVQLSGVNDFREGLHTLTQLLPHAERWRSFTLNAAFRPDLDVVSGFAVFRNRCLNLNLPNLVHAEFHYDDNHPFPVEARIPNTHFFTTWNAPNLRSLTVTNSIPPLFEANLTKFTMRFECMTTFAPRNLTPLFEFIASKPNLRELGFLFSYYFPSLVQLPRLVHHGIRSLSLEVEYTEFEWVPQKKAISALLSCVSFPKLSTLNADVSFEGGKSESDVWDDSDDVSVEDDGLEIEEMVNDLIPSNGLCPEIEHCSLRIIGYELTHPSLSLHHVLHALPKLRHLQIETNLELDPSFCACLNLQPKIRALELNNCELVDDVWVDDFLESLRRAGEDAWNQFQMLTVRACDELPKAALLKLLPKEKLTWIKEVLIEDRKDDPLENAFEDGVHFETTPKDAPLYMFDDECVGAQVIF